MSDSSRNCGVLTEVPAQPDALHATIGTRIVFNERPSLVGSPIINKNDLVGRVNSAQRRMQTRAKLIDEWLTLVDGNDDADLNIAIIGLLYGDARSRDSRSMKGQNAISRCAAP
ncbi:hypothetical protein AWH62_01350 [Maricaulis sp. W15]|nr:hypothetical protein AWH62_01350 [Maricaulis sp. W15]